MSAIRALGTGATSATAYSPDQAGYDSAIADLTALGGAIELSTGLEAIVLGVIPSGITVLRFRGTSPLGLEIAGGNIAIQTGQSFRSTDSGGTIRTILDVSGDFTRIAAVGNNGVRIIKNDGTVWATLTSTRLNLANGIDIAPNGSAGSIGDVLTSIGAAGSPAWTKPAGIPGSAMTVMLHAQLWAGGVNTATPGTGVYVYNSMANADVSNYMTFTLPLAYTATTTWKVFWTPTGGAGTTVTHGIGMFKHTAGMDFSTATFTMGAEVTSNSPAADILQVDTVGTPALSLAAGDTVTLRLRRRGDTDTSTFSSRFIGLLLSYT